PFAGEPLEDRGGAQPAVLVVDRADATAVREPDAGSRRGHPLVVGHVDEAIPEPPRRLLAQNAGGRAFRVSLDDAAGDVEVAVRPRERGRVEPERVIVPGPERGRRRARGVVERGRGRLLAPLGVAPAGAADPAARRRGPDA